MLTRLLNSESSYDICGQNQHSAQAIVLYECIENCWAELSRLVWQHFIGNYRIAVAALPEAGVKDKCSHNLAGRMGFQLANIFGKLHHWPILWRNQVAV